ncbi:MAG: hypothetical protein ABFD44_15535 [Anaerolineaceae bacterium]
MSNNEVKMLPFHAINGFMRDDYRTSVIHHVLSNLSQLPDDIQAPVRTAIRKSVQVPGFRNSAQAPVSMKVKPSAALFEKDPRFAAIILSAWSELHSTLRTQVYDLLSERGWELIPAEADRTRLPGFLITWKDGEDFDLINRAFQEKYNLPDVSADDISLMTVWISNRLPYSSED